MRPLLSHPPLSYSWQLLDAVVNVRVGDGAGADRFAMPRRNGLLKQFGLEDAGLLGEGHIAVPVVGTVGVAA